MRRYIPELDEGLVREAARNTHALWSGGRDLEAHTESQFAQLRRAGSALLRFVGLVDDSGLVASIKRYTLGMALPGGGSAGAVGIGAVFTRMDARGTGAASALIERVLAEARAEGLGAALLYSDIDPAFYERLGFVTLPAVSHIAPVSSLPSGTDLTRRPAREEDERAMLEAHDASFDASFLRLRRSLAAFRFFRFRNRIERAWILRLDGEDIGYVIADKHDSSRDDGAMVPPITLWVDEWASRVPLELPQVFGALRALAEHEGAQHVAGWLRPDHAIPPFTAVPRSISIPMVCPLGQGLRAEDIRPDRAYFGSFDHF
jgi:predicted N-acetyltransferase YhbS